MRNFDMMKLLSVFMIGFIALKSNANSVDLHDQMAKKTGVNDLKEKRGVIGGALLVGGIAIGASLLGVATIKGLMATGYHVAVSGVIENYSYWTMHFEGCEVKQGRMNKPMITVHPGTEEGFASHKSKWGWNGSWVYCTYRVSDSRVHIMYYAPYKFLFYKNVLALTITKPHVSLDARTMYHSKDVFISRRKYHNSVTPTKVCNAKMCISGIMGTSHKPEIKIKLYPRRFKQVCQSSKNYMQKIWHGSTSSNYRRFLNVKFNTGNTVFNFN